MLNLAWAACGQMLTSKVERSLQAQTMLIISTRNMTTATVVHSINIHVQLNSTLQTLIFYRQFLITDSFL